MATRGSSGRVTPKGDGRPARPPRTRTQRRQRAFAIIAGVAILALVLSTIAAGFTGTSRESPAPTTTAPPVTEPLAPPVEVSAPGPGEAITGETPCPEPDGSSPRTTSFENPPPICIDLDRNYTAVIDTTVGPITVLLNTSVAPAAVNNFIVLARYHYYDGVPFFLMEQGVAVVTGDPVGEPLGTGTPGYTIAGEIGEAGVIYPWGTLAMWNGEGDPDGGGAMFLIASGDRAAGLDPVYTVFGQVLDGAEAVRAIDQAGDPMTGLPTEEIRIEGITILEA